MAPGPCPAPGPGAASVGWSGIGDDRVVGRTGRRTFRHSDFDAVSLARARGGRPETFAGLAGVGDLVANVIAAGSPERHLGDRPGVGTSIAEIGSGLDCPKVAETITLLAGLARELHLEAPALDGLAALVNGQIEPAQWQTAISEPGAGRRRPARAA